MLARLIIVSFIAALLACTDKEPTPVTIAINPWPGYELLYLAEQQGFLKQLETNITLAQLGSLSDTQRAYLRGHVDGMASTLIEAIQAQVLGSQALKIVMVTDYSNGGDVIISHKSIASISDLKNLTVGCEVASLGIFMLQRALETVDLNLEQVKVVNIEQADGILALANGSIDAFVTYSPHSVEILKDQRNHIIFSSAELPNEIIDIISLSERSIQQNPGIVAKLHQAWELAYQFYLNNPEQALAIMAQREHISPEELNTTLSNDLVILQQKHQEKLLQPKGTLQQTIHGVCKALVRSQSLDTQCENLPNIIYQQP